MSESSIFTEISAHGMSVSIPATLTKVSESPDCDNSIFKASYRSVRADISSDSTSPTRDPFYRKCWSTVLHLNAKNHFSFGDRESLICKFLTEQGGCVGMSKMKCLLLGARICRVLKPKSL